MKQQIKDKISYIFKLVFNFEFFISILSSLLIGAGHIVDIYLNNVGEIYLTEVQTLFFEYLFVVSISTFIVAKLKFELPDKVIYSSYVKYGLLGCGLVYI